MLWSVPYNPLQDAADIRALLAVLDALQQRVQEAEAQVARLSADPLVLLEIRARLDRGTLTPSDVRWLLARAAGYTVSAPTALSEDELPLRWKP